MQEIVEKENIKDIIYEIRGVQVILDSDLAKLYHVETKRINEAVKNNLNKFPENYSWILTNEELTIFSRSKFSTLKDKKIKRGYNIKYMPRVFTEQGVYMLATILKSKVAVETTLNIIEGFVSMRKYFRNIIDTNDILVNHENRLLKLENVFDKTKEDINKIFFEGEIYDAYSLLMDILSKSSKEIIIIDNYAGKELLDILKNISKKIIIVSSNIDLVLKKKYESQYNNITFINNNSFHDRFIIIDREILYTCGSSFKDLGKKCFSINLLNNEYIKDILNEIM